MFADDSLARYSKIMALGEEQLERQRLRFGSTFESAFQRLDFQTKGYLTSLDLLIFMRNVRIDQFQEHDCQLVVDFYRNKFNGFIDYHGFVRMVLPQTQKKPQRLNRLNLVNERELALLLQMEIELLTSLKLLGCQRFDGQLSHSSFHDLVRERRTVELVFRRCDLNKDGLLSWCDLQVSNQDSLSPLRMQQSFSQLPVSSAQQKQLDEVFENPKQDEPIQIFQEIQAVTPLRLKSPTTSPQDNSKSPNKIPLRSRSPQKLATTHQSPLRLKPTEFLPQASQLSPNQVPLRLKSPMNSSPIRQRHYSPCPVNIDQLLEQVKTQIAEELIFKPITQIEQKPVISRQAPPRRNFDRPHRKRSTEKYVMVTGLRQRSPLQNSPLRKPARQITKDPQKRLKTLICETFEEQIYLERQWEKVKLELAEQPDFTCVESFPLLDSPCFNQLTREHFHSSLVQLLETCQIQSDSLFARFCSNSGNSEKFDYSDFQRLVLPSDPSWRTKVKTRVPRGQDLAPYTIKLFKKVFIVGLLVQQAHQMLKLNLNGQTGGLYITECWQVLTAKAQLSNYDLETLLIEHRKAGSRSLVSDCDLLLYCYTSQRGDGLTIQDFERVL